MSALLAGGSPDTRRRRARERADAPHEEEAMRIKVESEADIKDYAETTMNELLGWYGYDKLDTRGINLKHLNHHFPTSSSSSSPMRHDEDFSEDDTGLSQSPQPDSESLPNTNGGTIICAWCLKTGLKLFTLKTSSGKTKAFCSEPCFNQCRRAAFKKNRVCNWCRHVRHTVNYVDFKDGDEQLQFCSDKCLNQYKMQIFCKETQAYLQMNPHLQEEANKHAGAATSKLITPDLWLRDCQETMNGGATPGVSHSDDESSPPNAGIAIPKSSNGLEVEDLTLSSKSDRCNSSYSSISTKDRSTPHEQRSRNLDDSPVSKDKRSLEMCNALASYLRDDKEKSHFDRRKRNYESEKDHFRKRQKMSSLRHRSNPSTEAPPAHLSSTTHSPLSLQNQPRLFQPSAYPPSLNTSSPVPPAAHTKALPPHPAMAGPLLPPGLPPPPPLLNNDFLHSPFGSSFFQPSLSPQQHLDAVLRMQSGMRPGDHFPPHLFQESILPHLRNIPTQHSTNPFLQPNTVMLPYPIFVPLPVPIPVPIPLANFLSKDKKQGTTFVDKKQFTTVVNNKLPHDLDAGENSDSLNVDSEPDSKRDTFSTKSNISENDSNDMVSNNTPGKERHTPAPEKSSYAVINNDSNLNRLILTRNKPR